jgi:hypothetical protein
MSAHRLIRYPFCGTSIVPFDAYGRSLLRHRRHFLRGFSTRFQLFLRPSGDVPEYLFTCVQMNCPSAAALVAIAWKFN